MIWISFGNNTKQEKKNTYILWDSIKVSQKVLEFSNSQKIFFWIVNCQIPRREIPKNFPENGKISLKIRIAFFMLIMCHEKFHGILIIRSTRIHKDPSRLLNLRIIRGVDWRIKSTRSRIGVEKNFFFTPLNLPKSLYLFTFSKKFDLQKLGFNPN